MLVVHGLSALLIPPEHGALAGTAVDAVDVVHFPAFQILIRLRAAPGMNVQGVMAQRQFDVIGAGGADAAKGTDSVQGLVDCQHPGNAALGGDLIDDVGLRIAKLRLGLFQVVQHHRHGTVPFIFRFHGESCQRIHSRWYGRLRFRFRFRRHNGFLCRRRLRIRDRFLLFAAACQDQKKRQRQRPCSLFQGIPPFHVMLTSSYQGVVEPSREISPGFDKFPAVQSCPSGVY